MTNLGVGLASCAGLGASAMGQMAESRLGAAGIVRGVFADEPGEVEISPAGPVVASLSYDESAVYGFAGQDFESIFDLYDTFCCERFSIDADASLGECRSAAFGSDNPFEATDVRVEVYQASQEGDICDDGTLPKWVMRSTPGRGFFDGKHCKSDFGGQCLPAGDYVLRWGAELEFNCCGQMFFYGQAGPHDNGGGEPDDGFQSNPGNPFGMGQCFDVIDGATGRPTGINFMLSGEVVRCDGCTQDPNACGDWDNDADADADDFFTYLDSFAIGDACADLDGDGTVDADDLFSFLNRFVAPC